MPLQFAFYKHSRAVRRFDWAAEYRVPEAEADELEAHWCEAATASRSVRKRSAWPQLPGRGEWPPLAPLCTRPAVPPRSGPPLPDPAPPPAVHPPAGPPGDSAAAAQGPKAAPLAPGNQPLSSRKALPSTSAPSVISAPNATSAGPRVPASRAPGAAPAACAPQTPLEPAAGALKPEVDLLLREIRLLKGLLSRVVLGMRGPQAAPEPGAARGTAAPWAESPETSAAGS